MTGLGDMLRAVKGPIMRTEGGFVNGPEPLVSSGRDLIHAIQTLHDRKAYNGGVA
jgi:hypothetical protein